MDPDERAWEEELLDEACSAVLGDFSSIRTVCTMMYDDMVADGTPEWQAKRHTQRIMDEYFQTMAKHMAQHREDHL